MKKIFTFILVALSIHVNAQFRQGSTVKTNIIRYNFDTYQGTPIKTGWLFDDATYKKLYVSYNAADSLIKSFEKYQITMRNYDSANIEMLHVYETRIKEKDDLILKQNTDFNNLNTDLNKSNDNVKAYRRQFIKIGNTYIHVGTFVKTAITFGVLGFIAGKAL